ncbi:hypothetical protein [Adhaeribacter soli]|uniref:J domain-containing protein n=1 Tax=Adhaeribacter soli TaxID=2607655 RepID=A0A5N1J7H7_9BACT|nr:hypothetical protein [Adhaeribacter soli]KAA9340671.1 hypothetical protein F0P94_04385 [Adhaeribacter soli]
MPKPKKTAAEENNPASRGLTIGKKEKQVLSKAQQTFNRLVKRIEKLQRQIASDGQILEEKLNYYVAQIHPLETDELALRRGLLFSLYPYYTEPKKLPKGERKVLKEILINLLNEVLNGLPGEPDAELQEMFETLEGMTLEEAEKQDAEQMKKQMSEVFDAMGFDMDLSDLDLNASQEGIFQKINELEGDFERQAEPKEKAKTVRKKTKKQLEKEARERLAEELRNKSIGTIYKQLAKMLHPDLEPDAGQKTRKEALMKELTIAYKNNDLHTLLKLELEWIQAEETNLNKLTDEKLSIYNQVLKEQVADLEEEAFMVPQHPRFQALRRYAMFPGSLKYVDLKYEAKALKQNIKVLEELTTRLKTEDGLKEVKALLKMNRY